MDPSCVATNVAFCEPVEFVILKNTWLIPAVASATEIFNVKRPELAEWFVPEVGLLMLASWARGTVESIVKGFERFPNSVIACEAVLLKIVAFIA